MLSKQQTAETGQTILECVTDYINSKGEVTSANQVAQLAHNWGVLYNWRKAEDEILSDLENRLGVRFTKDGLVYSLYIRSTWQGGIDWVIEDITQTIDGECNV